jgi:tetratricopeptide (TPR) repeat protein
MKKQKKIIKILLGFLLVILIMPTLKAQSSYKVRLVEKVFNDLNNTFGEYRGRLKVEMVKGSKEIAQYTPQNNKILISVELYDLCRTLGADSLNALAVILGHELSHHYLKHTWHETYGLSKSTANVPTDIIRKLENEADFNGCYAAQLAGYYTQSAFPKIIDAIYQKFKLPENLHGYPSKQVRKETYISRSQELQRFVAVFRVGQILYSTKSFEKAAACFEYISKCLPSPEVLNNKATCLIQDYLERQRYKKFILPIEFDITTRLNIKSRSRGTDDLIKEAKKLLENAVSLNPDYQLARINLACTHVLLKNYAAGIGEINEISSPSADALTIRAIANFEEGQYDKAKADFELAGKGNGDKYQKNMELFKKLSPNSLSWLAKSVDTINSWCDEIFDNYYKKNAPVVTNMIETGFKPLIEDYEEYDIIVPNTEIKLTIKTNDQGLFKIKDSKYTIWFMESTFKGKSTKGVGVGDTDRLMLEKYGNQYKFYPLSMGIVQYVYTLKNNQKLIFVSQDKKIIQWALIFNQ